MIERYDFSYWPPMPHDLPPVKPAQDTLDEALGYRMAYISDPDRFRAVHATGEWADIEDFWLEADEPKPR